MRTSRLERRRAPWRPRCLARWWALRSAAAPVLGAVLGAGLVVGCEVVTGFDELTFEAPACVANTKEETCRQVECGSVTDNCGNEVSCDDTCDAPYACAVGGVDGNTCGCTGGSLQTPLTPAECSLAETVAGRSYYFCEALPWAEAQAFCQSFGTDLVVVESATENSYLQGRISANIWLGLRAMPPCDPNFGCEFSWVNGVVLDSAAFSNWNANEPNNTGGGELCVEMQQDLGRWNDVACANVLGVVCETTCPDG